MLATKDIVEKTRAALDPDMQAAARGFAAGVSRYVRELKTGTHDGRHASPLSPQMRAQRVPSVAQITEGLTANAPNFMAYRTGDVGSIMYAFGSDVTGGGGIQFGNPHFP